MLLAVGPGLAVAQFRALALAVTLALLASVLAHRLAHRRFPARGREPLLLLALGLLGWGVASAAWAPDPLHGAESALRLAAFVGLAALAARAVAADTPENRARIAPALAWGLAAGVALAAFDHATGNLFRSAVRGFAEATPRLGFGLKPAVSVLVVLLPLALAVPGWPRPARLALVAAGVAVALWLPAESAKLAVFAGLGATLLVAWLPRLGPPLLGAAAAGLILLAPLLGAAALSGGLDLSRLPPSAAHRVLIWDYAVDAIADAPLAGWGMEAARAMPDGNRGFLPETLARFRLDAAMHGGFFGPTSATQMPLHPHNAALHVWLELGLPGAVLAALLAFAAFRAAGRSDIPAPATGAVSAAFVVGLLSYGVWQPWWIGVQLLLMLAVIGLSGRRKA